VCVRIVKMATSRRRIYPSHGPLIDEPCFRKPCFAAALFGLRRFVAQSAFSLRLPTDYGRWASWQHALRYNPM
jgi:hypothetical protein